MMVHLVDIAFQKITIFMGHGSLLPLFRISAEEKGALPIYELQCNRVIVRVSVTVTAFNRTYDKYSNRGIEMDQLSLADQMRRYLFLAPALFYNQIEL